MTVLNNESKYIEKIFADSIAVKQQILRDESHLVLIEMAEQISASIQSGGKLMICGNGGSAADAQHLAAELLVRLRPHVNRQGIAALALSMDSSTATACGNDFGFECLYERMVMALGNEGDVLLGITTSGRSANVNLALKAAKKQGIKAFSFNGGAGGETAEISELSFLVPSVDTGRIQESHITGGHALMELVENKLLNDGFISQ